MHLKYSLHKIKNWEYWPQWLVYLPIIPVYLYYALRAKSLYFNVATNPGIENGGYIMESKFTLYNQLSKTIQPKTTLASVQNSNKCVIDLFNKNNFSFPIICKPNIGGKGVAVTEINNIEELENYHKKAPIDYLIQQKIPYSNEVGIFYYKYPNQKKGYISGIVQKNAIHVIGNGKSTLQELIINNPRYYYQRHFLFRKFYNQLNTVIPANEIVCLSSIGNHARGSMFTNITYKTNYQLEDVINNIAKQLHGFYFGRLDIMYNNWEDLCAGKNFYVVEINGSGSEPTHIYDPSQSIFTAWKIIIHHWQIMFTIAQQNLANGFNKPKFWHIQKLLRQWHKLEKKLKAM